MTGFNHALLDGVSTTHASVETRALTVFLSETLADFLRGAISAGLTRVVITRPDAWLTFAARYHLDSFGAEHLASVTKTTNMQQVRAYNETGKFPSPDGLFNDRSVSSDMSAAMKRLREACYRENAGTWFSLVLAVTAEGAATAKYNYDNEPEWNHEMDSRVYVADNKKFPRDLAHQPEWLQQKIAEGWANMVDLTAES